MVKGLRKFVLQHASHLDSSSGSSWLERIEGNRRRASELLGGLPQRPPTFEGLIHGLAAQTAFLCVTTAMLLQAWRMRRDPAWRGHFALAFGLAVVCFVAMWVHALWREAPRGLTQKAVIVLNLAWLGWAAVWLRRSGAAAGAPGASG